MKRLDANDILIKMVPPLVVLLIGTVIAKALGLLKFQHVVIGAVILFLIVVGIGVLMLLVERRSHQEDINDLIERLRAVIPPPGFDWVLSDADIASIEGKVKGSEIWIVSPDLHYDLIKRNFQDLTKKNFKRGITYTYIVPKSEPMHALIPILKQVYSPYLGQIRIRQIPEETFRVLAVTHIDIYNPNMSHNEGARVFLELPVKQRGYWVEVSQDAALGLIGRFRKIVEDEDGTFMRTL